MNHHIILDQFLNRIVLNKNKIKILKINSAKNRLDFVKSIYEFNIFKIKFNLN
jgi:hypothetical protein